MGVNGVNENKSLHRGSIMNKETLREKMRELELNASLTDLFFNLFPRLNVDEFFNITKAVKEIFNRHSFISQSESKQTDSNEVKELVELLDEHIYGTKHKEDLADAILQAGYTKNKGEKVFEGDASMPDIDDMAK